MSKKRPTLTIDAVTGKMELDRQVHNSDLALRYLTDRGVFPKVGVVVAQVAHDDWCASHKGGFCDCRPEVTVGGVKHHVPNWVYHSRN